MFWGFLILSALGLTFVKLSYELRMLKRPTSKFIILNSFPCLLE